MAINNPPRVDFYNEKAHWLACIYEMYAGWWSVRYNRVELLSCYHTEEEAYAALCGGLDIPNLYIRTEL